MDIRSLIRASYDPGRFSTAYHREKRALKQNFAEAAAAQNAPEGSVLARNNPYDYGTAAKQRFGNVFGRVDANSSGPPSLTRQPPAPDQPPPERRGGMDISDLLREGAPSSYEEMMAGRSNGPTIMAPPWLPGQARPNMLSRDAYKPFTGYTRNNGTRSYSTNRPPFFARRPGGR